MVDFNNETTIATPSFELVKILIMEKAENVSLAIGLLEKNKALNMDVEHELAWVISRNKTLFYSIEPWIKDAEGQIDLNNMLLDLDKVEEEAQLNLYRYMVSFLYKYGLTKINLRKQRTGLPDAEKENIEDGF